ncbi:DNA methyltransferase [Vagococcus salmoninarum]|uniref:DNA methyltransferase n=1 Tax=Vagococcus salmoninarum TaxID=2739 RepID=UPI00398B0EAB
MAKIKKLSITEIEDRLKKVITNINQDSFIEEFLSLYEIPKTSITRAKKNLAEGKDFIIKNRVFYREVSDDVVLSIDAIEQEILGEKSLPRYIVATDFHQLAAVDTKTRETLNISIEELPANADFFLAWNGIEKADYQAESPADRKAAERFAKLYDVVARDNPNANEHTFNLFLIRTLFLLFAEDTGIIEKGLFTNALKTRTDEEGNNFNVVIKELFEILDISPQNRKHTPEWLIQFPYVNGKLFGEPHADLVFSKKSRELLIEAGELLNWNEINPDILGAMIQSVASEEDRHVTGMHYTSVSNIMKLIGPLFLNELTSCFDNLEKWFKDNCVKHITEKTREENNKFILTKLNELLDRISKIIFLDPACGSGNFLIIVYKELRKLEIKILLLVQTIEKIDFFPLSRINLEQFNGIEIDGFAHEVAKLSLWIAEHQMNEEMVRQIPSANLALLPLKDAGNIINANALRIDWNSIISSKVRDEIYILGNPPYLGSNKWTKDKNKQKDMELVFYNMGAYKKLDYISSWFIKAAEFLRQNNSLCAFVTTNSITQGEQAPLLWSKIFDKSIEIFFGVQNFKWSNSAKGQAAVVVQIIGMSKKRKIKYLFYDDKKIEVNFINEYLTEGEIVGIEKKSKSISLLDKMEKGSQITNSKTGGLLFTEGEYLDFIAVYPNYSKYFRKFINGEDLLNGGSRYVLYIKNEFTYNELNKIPELNKRFLEVESSRMSSTKKTTRELAEKPWCIGENRYTEQRVIVSPQTASENYMYIPMTIVDESVMVVLVSNLRQLFVETKIY